MAVWISNNRSASPFGIARRRDDRIWKITQRRNRSIHGRDFETNTCSECGRSVWRKRIQFKDSARKFSREVFWSVTMAMLSKA